MDKRIIIIALLAFIAVILTVVKESRHDAGDPISRVPASEKKEISGERLFAMADTTLKTLGVKKENIRPLKGRNDVRVLYPRGFDVLNFISVMKDSLEEFNAKILSVDNAKERATVVQIKNDDAVIRSFLFSTEPVTAIKKGASPSLQKKQTR
ncbi:MAG: hypothetical protein WCT99_11135 [Bacteroidota bacterium]